jgi:hypothetical protein
MTLTFTPSAFSTPYTMLSMAEAADVITVALNGPWVYEHQDPTSVRREEAEQAQEQSLVAIYDLLREGDLNAYVEDIHRGRFLRVPLEYYLDDAWGFGRCITLTKLMNEGIPPDLNDQPLLILRSELDAWVAGHARRATAKRGRTAKYDWPPFDAHALERLEYHGGFMGIDWAQKDLEEEMKVWAVDRWGSEPSESTIRHRISKIIVPRYDADRLGR